MARPAGERARLRRAVARAAGWRARASIARAASGRRAPRSARAVVAATCSGPESPPMKSCARVMMSAEVPRAIGSPQRTIGRGRRRRPRAPRSAATASAASASEGPEVMIIRRAAIFARERRRHRANDSRGQRLNGLLALTWSTTRGASAGTPAAAQPRARRRPRPRRRRHLHRVRGRVGGRDAERRQQIPLVHDRVPRRHERRDARARAWCSSQRRPGMS